MVILLLVVYLSELKFLYFAVAFVAMASERVFAADESGLSPTLYDSTLYSESPDGFKVSNTIWRQPTYQAATSCFLLLRLYQISADYGAIMDDFPKPTQNATLLDISEVCKAYGLSASCQKWGPSELKSSPLPCIAHLSSNISLGGRFLVILSMEESYIVFLDGVTGSPSKMPADVFFRNWSGYVVAATNRIAMDRLILFVAVFGLLCLVLIVVYQFRKHPSSTLL
jgi:hypothetical protein